MVERKHPFIKVGIIPKEFADPLKHAEVPGFYRILFNTLKEGEEFLNRPGVGTEVSEILTSSFHREIELRPNQSVFRAEDGVNMVSESMLSSIQVEVNWVKNPTNDGFRDPENVSITPAFALLMHSELNMLAQKIIQDAERRSKKSIEDRSTIKLGRESNIITTTQKDLNRRRPIFTNRSHFHGTI